MSKSVFCWHCNGKGTVRSWVLFSKSCPVCAGRGMIEVEDRSQSPLTPNLARILNRPSVNTKPPTKPRQIVPPPHMQPFNPQNPNSPLHRRHPFNPNNPNSPWNPNNPMNPNSPRNPNNPMNPNSPRNPHHPMNPHNPNRR